MRFVTLITATAVMGVWVGNPHVVNWKANQLAEDEKRVAIELSCGDVEAWLQPECEDDLTQEFATGTTTPLSIVRLHCTRFENVWELQSGPARSELCEQFPEAGAPS